MYLTIPVIMKLHNRYCGFEYKTNIAETKCNPLYLNDGIIWSNFGSFAGWLFLFTPTNFLLLVNQILQCTFAPEGIEFCAWKEVVYLGWMDNKVFKSSKNNLIFICISKKQNYVHYSNFCISILVINSWNLVSISSFNSQISLHFPSLDDWEHISQIGCAVAVSEIKKSLFWVDHHEGRRLVKTYASFLMTSAQSILLLTFNIFFNLQ